MKFIVVAACVGLYGAGVGSNVASAQQKKGQQKVVGAVWEFEAKESAKKSAKVIQSGRFRATLDGRVYTPKDVQVGTYKYTNKAKDKVTLEMTEGKLKGTIELVKSGVKSPTWQGTWKLEDGSSAHLVIRMLKD